MKKVLLVMTTLGLLITIAAAVLFWAPVWHPDIPGPQQRAALGLKLRLYDASKERPQNDGYVPLTEEECRSVWEWLEQSSKRGMSVSLISYAPRMVVRGSNMNVNLLDNVVVLNIEIDSVWRQYQWHKTTADEEIERLLSERSGR